MKRAQRSPCGQKGVSLIELMIALAIGLVIVGAATLAFIGANQTRTEIDKTSRQYENGRYALQLLTNELRLAGFWGDFFADGGYAIAEPANPCNISTALELGWNTAAATYPPHIRGWDNASPECNGMVRRADTDVILVRHAGTDVIATSELGGYSNNILLQMSRCTADNATGPLVKLGSTGAAGFTYKKKMTGDAAGVCSGTADLRRLLTYIYFVDTDAILHRLEVAADNTWSDVKLVDGIEELQIEYDVDTSGDGIPDTLDQLATGVAGWADVMSATVYVLARNTETTSGHADAKTYQLGARTVAAKNDGYKRHVYAQKVYFPNPAGRRAQ